MKEKIVLRIKFHKKSFKLLWLSAAVCWNCLLDLLAFCANQFGILASVHAAWNAAQETGGPQKAQTPQNGSATDFLSWELLGVSSAE